MTRAAAPPASPFGTVLPWVVLSAAMVVLTVFALLAMDLVVRDAAAPGAWTLYVTAAGCLGTAVGVVLVQAIRVGDRVAGPEHRLIESLRRLRSGDLSFRVSLRRGDLLTDLADECNRVLEWLNANPPAGTRTGTDVFDVEVESAEADEVALAATGAEEHP